MLNSSPVLLTSRPFYLLKEWRKLWLFVNLSALEQILMCQLFQMKRPNVLGSFRYCCKRKQMKNTCGLCLSGWSFKKEARWFWEVYHRNMQVWNYMGWCLSNVKIHVGIFSHWRSLLVILTVSSCFFLIFHFFFFTNASVWVYNSCSNRALVLILSGHKRTLRETLGAELLLCWGALCW